MPYSGPRVSRAEIVLLVALAAWAFFPLVLLLAHAGADPHHLHRRRRTDRRRRRSRRRPAPVPGLGPRRRRRTGWPRICSRLTPSATSTSSRCSRSPARCRGSGSRCRWPTCCGSRAVVALFLAAVAWARRAFADRAGRAGRGRGAGAVPVHAAGGPVQLGQPRQPDRSAFSSTCSATSCWRPASSGAMCRAPSAWRSSRPRCWRVERALDPARGGLGPAIGR